MNEDVVEYYNNFLPVLASYHKIENPRIKKVKKLLYHAVLFSKVHLGISKSRILDLGCGTGLTTHFMAELSEIDKVIGIDVAPRLIEYAKENSWSMNAEYRVGDIMEMSAVTTYDIVTVIDCLEHIRYVYKALEFILHSVRPGGLIVFNFPHSSFTRYIQEHKPELLQIVDLDIDLDHFMVYFRDKGFVPVFCDIYGIDYPVQYVSLILMGQRSEHLLYPEKEVIE